MVIDSMPETYLDSVTDYKIIWFTIRYYQFSYIIFIISLIKWLFLYNSKMYTFCWIIRVCVTLWGTWYVVQIIIEDSCFASSIIIEKLLWNGVWLTTDIRYAMIKQSLNIFFYVQPDRYDQPVSHVYSVSQLLLE